MLRHRELGALVAHAVLVVGELDGHVLVPVAGHVCTLLTTFLHAFHLVAIYVLLLFIIYCHLAIYRSLLYFVRHHACLTVVELSVRLGIVADSGGHLMMVRLVNHRIVMRVSFARVEGALIFGAQRLVYVQRPVVHVLSPDYRVIGLHRRVIDSSIARIVDRVVQEAIVVLLLHVFVLGT